MAKERRFNDIICRLPTDPASVGFQRAISTIRRHLFVFIANRSNRVDKQRRHSGGSLRHLLQEHQAEWANLDHPSHDQ